MRYGKAKFPCFKSTEEFFEHSWELDVKRPLNYYKNLTQVIKSLSEKTDVIQFVGKENRVKYYKLKFLFHTNNRLKQKDKNTP